MALFQYTAFDGHGQMVRGEIRAADEAAAILALRGQGLRPSRVRQGSASLERILHADLNPAAGLGTADLVQFLDELALLAGEGISLKEALRVAADLRPPGRSGAIIRSLEEDLTAGQSLAQAMEARPRHFPQFVRAMVRAGEQSGALEAVLTSTVDYMRRSLALKRRIISALTYPAILLAVTIGSIALLLTMVVPQFEPLFRQAGESLPPSTQALIVAADFTETHGPWIALVLAGLAALLLVAGRDEGMARALGRVQLRLPLVGRLITDVESARFARTLSVTLGHGMDLLRAIEVCNQSVSHPVFRAGVARVMDRVKGGARLGPAFEAEALGTPVLRKLILLGEQSGQHAEMLAKAADLIEQKVQRRIDTALALLVPLITVIMGGIVGGAMYAIFTAVFSVNTLI